MSGWSEPEHTNWYLALAQTQLAWLQELGYEDVDCLWKWMEPALLCGAKTSGAQMVLSTP